MAITPTTILSYDQVFLTGSPVNLRIQNIAKDSAIQSVQLELYVWSGDLDSPPPTASYTLVSNKVSSTDNYIYFQISEILASHINGTKFAWQGGDNPPSIAGEGVFFQYKYVVTNVTAEAPVESVTNFATLGYRYDYEQVGDVALTSFIQPYLELKPQNYSRNYTDRIKYFTRNFDFGHEISTCTSENFILSELLTPTVTKCQLGDKYLVVYLNALGVWDYFTSYGKVVKSVKLGSEVNPRLYRNPNSINNNVNHSKTRQIESSDQTYILNTGDLNESMTSQVEEVIYSPLIYLIEFTGEIYTAEQDGITVDSTTVTVDSTLYTASSNTITSADIGFYSTFKQIPVICSTESFTKKSRLNDKGKINYDLQFEVTTGRINNLR